MTEPSVETTSSRGQVALVTGSSRGIGRAIAIELARHGTIVAAHGRDTDALEDVQQHIKRQGGQCFTFVAELTDSRQVNHLVRQIEDEVGPIEILVANAGGSPTRPEPVEEVSEEDFRATVEVNLMSTFFTIKAVLPGMKKRGRGNIVTISSGAARRPHAQSPIAYAASKAAVELLTKDVALQAGPHGVRANCVSPETILTNANLARIPSGLQESMAADHPVPRLGVPEDIAKAVRFLTSEESAWITGVVLDVAGGAVITQ